MRLPDFVIIGAMKSATSTLHDQLAEQSGIFMSTPKEPCYFSDDPVFARGVEWYAGLFEAAPAGALCGESSTHYTKLPTYPDTALRLARLLPKAKLVYVMRHPVDRLVSHYIHGWTEGEIRVPIDRALDLHPELIHYGRYAMQLDAYLEHFDRSAILPVFFERVRDHGPEELERVARFVGHAGPVTWSAEQTRKNVSSDRLRKSAWRDALVYAPGLSTLRRRLVPQSVRDRIKGLWQMRERPELSAASRARLARELDPDLARLGQQLGVQLSCESFARTVCERPLSWVDA